MYTKTQRLYNSGITFLMGSVILSVVLCMGIVVAPTKVGADEETPLLTTIQADAHTTLADAFATYDSANYSPENWNYLTSLRSDADTAIDTAVNADDIALILVSATTNMANVPIDLDRAKASAHAYMQQLLATYTESDYSGGNWSNLIGYITDADNVITDALDMATIQAAQTTARDGMATVNADIAGARADAHTAVANTFTARLTDSYTPENYSNLVNYRDRGFTDIALAATNDSITSAQLAAISDMNSVPTITVDFAEAKIAAHGIVDAAFVGYVSSEYLPQEWERLVSIKTAGNESIETAETIADVALVRSRILADMEGILTIARFNAVPLPLVLSTTAGSFAVTDPLKSLAVTVGADVASGTLDVSSFISGGTGQLPPITITAANLGGVEVAIASSTTVTSADTAWNGIMNVPMTTTVVLPTVSGQTRTLVSSLEIGSSDTHLTFTRAVRLLFPNQAGKRAGYSLTDSNFKEIVGACVNDTQIAADTLAPDSECKIDVGADLVVWTKHFTKFATYTQVSTIQTSSGRGSGGAVVSSVVTTSTAPRAGRVLGASSYIFTQYMRYGITAEYVRELQEKLRTEGYFTYPLSTGYFGSVTLSAVKAYQAAQGLPSTGYVGPLTVALLNK